jgi:hypothetical protein
MTYKILHRKLNNGIQNTEYKNKQWHTKHCIENYAMAYKTLHRKISNGIQNNCIEK